MESVGNFVSVFYGHHVKCYHYIYIEVTLFRNKWRLCILDIRVRVCYMLRKQCRLTPIYIVWQLRGIPNHFHLWCVFAGKMIKWNLFLSTLCWNYQLSKRIWSCLWWSDLLDFVCSIWFNETVNNVSFL